MSVFEVLAGACDPDPSCPKVVRVAPGALVVVGMAIAAPGTGSMPTSRVSITAELYGAAADRLPDARPPALLVPDTVLVDGRPITEPSELIEFGVGPGEGAVRISESAFITIGARVAS